MIQSLHGYAPGLLRGSAEFNDNEGQDQPYPEQKLWLIRNYSIGYKIRPLY